MKWFVLDSVIPICSAKLMLLPGFMHSFFFFKQVIFWEGSLFENLTLGNRFCFISPNLPFNGKSLKDLGKPLHWCLTQERLLGAQPTIRCSFADVERTILSFIFSLRRVSLDGGKEVIRIEGKISLFSVGNQDTSICECGQRIKHSVDSQNTMERESSYFLSSATEQIVSWHGYQVERACTYEKWSFPNNFYRNRILLAVPKMLS